MKMESNTYKTVITSLHFARTYELVLEGRLSVDENKYLFSELQTYWPEGPFKNFDLNFGVVHDASEVSAVKHLGSMKIKRRAPHALDVCYQPSDDEFLEGFPGHSYWMSLTVYSNIAHAAPRYLKCFWMSDFEPLEMKEVMREVEEKHDLASLGEDINV